MPDHIDKYTDQQEAAYARKIAATYKKAAQEVRRQITEFAAKHKAKAAKLLQQVNAGEISMADYQAWLQGQVFIGKQWQDKLDDIVRVYTDADEKARQLMRGTVRDVFTESANYAAYQLEDRLGAAVDFHLYDAKTVDRLMRTDPQMLPEWKINEKKDYTWNEERVRSTLTRAIIQGKPIPDIADELGQQLATGNAKKMVLFARTAMTGAQNAGRVERLHDTQQMGIRVKKKWLAAHDARVRDTHAYLDGQERDVDEDFTVGDMHIAYPGDPTAPPELVYNCRCTMIYVYPEHQAEHVGEKTESYEEWLEEKRRKKEEQAPAENVTEEQPESNLRWTREEYEKAKAERDEVLQREQAEAEQWFEEQRVAMLDEYGGAFIRQRIAIRNDETLTDEEKAQKLEELSRKEAEFKRRRSELASERDERFQAAYDKYNATFEPEYEYPHIEGEATTRENATAVNPNFSTSSFAYSHNCQRCAVAFELRERGYDVEALAAPPEGGLGARAVIDQIFQGAEQIEIAATGHESTIEVMEKMQEWGDGSRAVIIISRDSGNGHVFNAEMIDGHFTIVDSQWSAVWDDSQKGKAMDGGALEEIYTDGIIVYRVDNVPVHYVPDGWVAARRM